MTESSADRKARVITLQACLKTAYLLAGGLDKWADLVVGMDCHTDDGMTYTRKQMIEMLLDSIKEEFREEAQPKISFTAEEIDSIQKNFHNRGGEVI